MNMVGRSRVFAALFVFAAPAAFAQWNPAGATDTTSISHSGTVTIGTSTITAGYSLDVSGASRLSGNVFLGSPIVGVPTLYLWPDTSGSYIHGTGTGIDIVGMGGLIQLANGNTLVAGYNPPGSPATTALTVRGSTATSTSSALNVTDSSQTPLMFVRNDGAVGVGTAAPKARLHAFSPSGPAAVRAETGDIAGTSATMAVDNVVGAYLVAHTDTANLATAPYSAHRVAFGANYFVVAFSAATAVNQTRAWTNQFLIDATGKVGIGRDAPGAALDVNGDVLVSGALTAQRVIGATYQDIAEWVPASEPMPPGTVVVVDPRRDNGVVPSSRAYDTSVAGVVSAQPGVVLGVAGPAKEQIATTGRVKVRVDASHAAIHAGDLLVTSDKSGMAMRSEPIEFNGRRIHQPGTLIGKALQPLAGGVGEILVLLSLQ